MTDYNHELLFGAALAPSAGNRQALLQTAELAEDLGLDLVGFQDHPYQPAFLDTWTLLSVLDRLREDHERIAEDRLLEPIGRLSIRI